MSWIFGKLDCNFFIVVFILLIIFRVLVLVSLIIWKVIVFLVLKLIKVGIDLEVNFFLFFCFLEVLFSKLIFKIFGNFVIVGIIWFWVILVNFFRVWLLLVIV